MTRALEMRRFDRRVLGVLPVLTACIATEVRFPRPEDAAREATARDASDGGDVADANNAIDARVADAVDASDARRDQTAVDAPCGDGYSLCNGVCRDLLHESRNCGRCNARCAEDADCDGGVCECMRRSGDPVRIHVCGRCVREEDAVLPECPDGVIACSSQGWRCYRPSPTAPPYVDDGIIPLSCCDGLACPMISTCSNCRCVMPRNR